jgi:cytochrome P450
MPDAVQSYRPPAPFPRRMLSSFDGNILNMLAAGFFRRKAVRLPDRGADVLVVNDPDEIRNIMSVSVDAFPKSDMMVAALEPLIGDGIFVSNGEIWRRQRRMLEPALEQMRVRRLYPLMSASVRDFVVRLRALSPGAEINLDAEMIFVALDIIFRTIFSQPIGQEDAREISDAFLQYQTKAPQDILTLLFGGGAVEQTAAPGELAAIAGRIRAVVARMVDERLASAERQKTAEDILQAAIEARDPADGSAFSREELINQVTVFFLAGHETTASVLTWAAFMLSQLPPLAETIRTQTLAVAGARAVGQDELGKIAAARNVFRETLRLYPPLAFVSRVATRPATICGNAIGAGSFVVVSPWLVHRHHDYWKEPDIFDAERFAEGREREIVPGTFIPFGLGARVCTGRIIAMIEGPLVIAELMRAVRLTTLNPQEVAPTFRLTLRPNVPIRCRVELLPA